jgi:transposase InsO family protein
MVQSMSRVAYCIDNGPMEVFWGILESEMYYLRKFSDYESLKKVSFWYLGITKVPTILIGTSHKKFLFFHCLLDRKQFIQQGYHY